MTVCHSSLTEYEYYIKNINKKLMNVDVTEIPYIMYRKDAEYLKNAGYLSNYTMWFGNLTKKIDCKFIVFHYFDIKKRNF